MAAIPTTTVKGDPIESLDHLLHILSDGNKHSFRMQLFGGAYSRKVIYAVGNGKYDLCNCIDDTWQTLGKRQLIMEKHTGLIGEAIRKGAFTYDGTE